MSETCETISKKEEYEAQIAFIAEQIEKCEQSIRKNQQEIVRVKNKKEKLLLKDLSLFLECKIKYLSVELKEIQNFLPKTK